MLLQLTSLGRSLINAEPVGVQITRVDFGDSFNYAVADDPTGLDGDIVYVSNTAYQPRIVNTNSVRYTVVLDKTVASVTFGEMALYSGSDLIGVAVSPTQIHKIGPGGGEDGADLRLDVFVDASGSERYAQVELVSSKQSNSFPRYPVPDLLEPPAKNENNAYVIYGQTENDLPYLAFADPTGKWSFSNKPSVYFEGSVHSINSLGMQASSLTGDYDGDPTDLVLQFVSGRQRGYCRILTEVLDTGGFQWNTPLADLPEVGDAFIVLGPAEAVSGGGASSLVIQVGLPGGETLEDGQHLHTAIVTSSQIQNLALLLDPDLAWDNVAQPSIVVSSTTVDDGAADHYHALTIKFNFTEHRLDVVSMTTVVVSEGPLVDHDHICSVVADGTGSGGSDTAPLELKLSSNFAPHWIQAYVDGETSSSYTRDIDFNAGIAYSLISTGDTPFRAIVQEFHTTTTSEDDSGYSDVDPIELSIASPLQAVDGIRVLSMGASGAIVALALDETLNLGIAKLNPGLTSIAWAQKFTDVDGLIALDIQLTMGPVESGHPTVFAALRHNNGAVSVLKLNSSTGAVIWHKALDEAVLGDTATPTSISVFSHNSGPDCVLVCGTASAMGVPETVFAICINAATSSLIWHQKYEDVVDNANVSMVGGGYLTGVEVLNFLVRHENTDYYLLGVNPTTGALIGLSDPVFSSTYDVQDTVVGPESIFVISRTQARYKHADVYEKDLIALLEIGETSGEIYYDTAQFFVPQDYGNLDWQTSGRDFLGTPRVSFDSENYALLYSFDMAVNGVTKARRAYSGYPIRGVFGDLEVDSGLMEISEEDTPTITSSVITVGGQWVDRGSTSSVLDLTVTRPWVSMYVMDTKGRLSQTWTVAQEHLESKSYKLPHLPPKRQGDVLTYDQNWDRIVWGLPNSQMVAFHVGTDNNGDVIHHHLAMLSVEDVKFLVAAATSSPETDSIVFAWTDVVEDHSHRLSIRYDQAERRFVCTEVTNNQNDNHTVTQLPLTDPSTLAASIVTHSSGETLNVLSAHSGRYIRLTGETPITVSFAYSAGYSIGQEYHFANRSTANVTLSGASANFNPPKGGSLVLEPGDTVTVKIVAIDPELEEIEADVFGSTEAA